MEGYGVIREWRISVEDASRLLLMTIRQVPVVGLHSVQTAKAAALIARIMGYDLNRRMVLYLLGGLHDVGLMLPEIREREEKLSRDEGILELIKDEDLMKKHGPIGARIIESIPLLQPFSFAIEHHHTPAVDLEIGEGGIMANMLNAANVMSLKLLEHKNMADEEFKKDYVEYIKSHKSDFFPDVREAAIEASKEEAYMMMVADERPHWWDFVGIDSSMDLTSFMNFLTLMDYLVDSMTPQTENHSTRVAFLAREMAKEILTEAEGTGVYLAGRMHDLGKIFLPRSVVAKRDERDYVFKTHVIKTYELLESFKGFQSIISWAVTHHERLDGSGYPWHLTSEKLSIPARILQIADEYVSLLEKGELDALKIMKEMAKGGKFDIQLVDILERLVKNGYNVMNYYDVVGMYIKEVERDE